MNYNEEMDLGYRGGINPIARPLKYRAPSVARCSRRKHQRGEVGKIPEPAGLLQLQGPNGRLKGKKEYVQPLTAKKRLR